LVAEKYVLFLNVWVVYWTTYIFSFLDGVKFYVCGRVYLLWLHLQSISQFFML